MIYQVRVKSQGRLPAGLDTYSGLSLMVEQENEKLAVSSQNYEHGMKRLLQRVLLLMKNIIQKSVWHVFWVMIMILNS